MSSATIGGVAGGNISPARFVKRGTTVGTLLQAGAGEQICGISATGTHTANLAGLDDGFAAVSGENLRTFREPGQICYLQTGAAVAIGARLKSDASGRGIAVTTAGDEYGAVAEEAAGAADLWILVRFETGKRG